MTKWNFRGQLAGTLLAIAEKHVSGKPKLRSRKRKREDKMIIVSLAFAAQAVRDINWLYFCYRFTPFAGSTSLEVCCDWIFTQMRLTPYIMMPGICVGTLRSSGL